MNLLDEVATQRAGAALAAVLKPGDIVLLEGALGAGKTTLVRGLLRALGHDREVPSPSFAIVQPYDDVMPPVWHVDLYRIDSPSELAELGLDAVLAEGALVVEWPGRAGEGAWPPSALTLSLAMLDDGSRALTEKLGQGWEGRWPPR